MVGVQRDIVVVEFDHAQSNLMTFSVRRLQLGGDFQFHLGRDFIPADGVDERGSCVP